MLDQIFNSPMMDHLGRGLKAASLRQEVIANNIANVNTPQFKKSEVIFEDLLARELQGPPPSDGKLPLALTHQNHIGPKETGFRAEAVVKKHPELTMRADGNNVDIDEEMASLAKNELYYSFLTKSLGDHFSQLNKTITSKG